MLSTSIRLICSLFLVCLFFLPAQAKEIDSIEKKQELSRAREVVFIDAAVKDAQTILARLPEGAEVIFLKPGADGVKEITGRLGQRRDLSIVRIIAHGSQGRLVLGSAGLDLVSLPRYREDVLGWSDALAAGGDLLIYSCDLAQEREGRWLVDALAKLTDRDVAASTNKTGGKNGDWDLEYYNGAIQAAALDVPDYAFSLYTITFPSNNWVNNFSENGHEFTVSGEGYVWENSAVMNSSYGTVNIAKTSGNPMKVNHLSLKAYWGGFNVTIKGWNGGTQKYSQGASLGTSYSQINLSNWTGIDKISVTGASNGSFNVDNIDYTVENVAPSNIALSSSSVADEDPSGTTVGSFSSTDSEDPGGHTYTFASGGTDNASFTISGSELRTAFVADHDTKSSYSSRS